MGLARKNGKRITSLFCGKWIINVLLLSVSCFTVHGFLFKYFYLNKSNISSDENPYFFLNIFSHSQTCMLKSIKVEIIPHYRVSMAKRLHFPDLTLRNVSRWTPRNFHVIHVNKWSSLRKLGSPTILPARAR